MEILIALLVVALIGLVAGVVLTFANKFFFVPEDKTEKQIRECLPGVNCGACGFTGCDEYAKALAKGEAKPDLCIPGSTDSAEAIAKILGVEVEAPKDLVAVLKCNGNCNAAKKKAIFDGATSCKAMSLVYGGPNECKFGCIGCGDCVSVGPANAISIREGIAFVDTRFCIGCGLCKNSCPKKLFELISQDRKTLVLCNNKEKGAVARKACANACIGCKKCELNCPQKAITVNDNLARIDYEKCVDCGLCADNCPTKCIKKVDLYTAVMN